MNPDTSGLAAYPGVFQNVLLKKMYKALELAAEGVTTVPGLKSQTTLHRLLVKKGLKPYTGTFISKDDLTFEPRTLSVQKAQRDLSIEPSKYLNTYMEALRGAGENAKNMTIPFAQVMWESVLEELAEEIVTDTLYYGQGKAAFATWGSGSTYAVGALIKYTQGGEIRYFEAVASTTAGQSPDTHPAKWAWAGGKAVTQGFKYHLDAEETLGTIVPVSTGAISSSTAYAQFTSVWRDLDEQLRKKGAVIYCSQNSLEMLLDDYENKISKNFESIDGITYLAKTDRKASILPVSWLSGSGKVIATPPGNFWMGTDQTSDMNVIKTIEQMYTIDAGITFMIGTQIADPAAISMNDQD